MTRMPEVPRLSPRVRRVLLGVGAALFAVWNAFWFLQLAIYARNGFPLNDWSSLATMDPASPYLTDGFHWSIPAAWLWAYAVVPLGFGIWSALHVVVLATLPRAVALAALVTFPFWADVAAGNMVTFAFVLAWHALAGRRWAVLGFVVLAALIPRPLMLPVLIWVLYRSKEAWIGFIGATLAVVLAGLATQTLWTYLSLILGTSSSFWYTSPWNIGPSSLIGPIWVPFGLAIAAVATWKGWLGVASLAASPYLIHYYAVFALLDLRDRIRPRSEPSARNIAVVADIQAVDAA
jgi:hypothetical protein